MLYLSTLRNASNLRMSMKYTCFAVTMVGAGVLAGCGGGNATQPDGTTATTQTVSVEILPIEADAGVPLGAADPAATLTAPGAVPSTDPAAVPAGDPLKDQALGRIFAVRSDPFSLLAPERIYEGEQDAARLLQNSGGFTFLYEPPPPPVPEEATFEPQPPRRLSGIVQADGIIALIQMENGQTYEIWPGRRIEGTPWTVVSVDTEKAILRREGNVLPRTVVVPLQGLLDGGLGQTQPQQGGPGGFPGGGPPPGFGGPPGNVPGGLGAPEF